MIYKNKIFMSWDKKQKCNFYDIRFSGADMSILVRDACYQSIRKL